jgi:Ribonucleotide reductase, barrel domain
MRQFSDKTVITGRVKRWLDNPISISPISCTNVVVEDSYFEIDGDYEFLDTIAGSRVFTTMALKGNAGVSINLSKLRPKGTVGSQGLVAQGVTNFMEAYSVINAEVRRGNGFKNGAVNLCLDYTHPDYLDFLKFDRLPWAKKVTYLPTGFKFTEAECTTDRFQALLAAIAAGKTFVYKQQRDTLTGNLLETNVCMGLSLANRSTCTLAHLNLGKIARFSEIPEAMLAVAKDLDWIWEQFEATQPNHFNDANRDKQVGMGYVGLANLLAAHSISYKDFARSMAKMVNKPEYITFDLASDRLATYLSLGYKKVQEFAEEKGYKRFFAIEPTASCSYRELDLAGYTTCPEISPPTCHPLTKVSTRISDDESRDYQYPPNVECSGTDVDFATYTSLCESFQILANRTGLSQGISYNWWLDEPVTKQSFLRWVESPLKTIYYRWATSSTNQDKTSYSEVPVSQEDEEFWSANEPEVSCQINDKNYCEACAG